MRLSICRHCILKNHECVCFSAQGKRIFEFISMNYTDVYFNVDSIGYSFDISRTYLYEICNRDFHVNPSMIVRNFRIGKALLLLMTNNQKTTIIARESGYLPRTLNYQFRRVFGMSIGEYRKILKRNSSNSLEMTKTIIDMLWDSGEQIHLTNIPNILALE